jgi:predicted RNA-binding protein with PIN domain
MHHMPYLIDGHNLIGAHPEIDLSDPEDEVALIERLEAYFAEIGKSATLYFDHRAPEARKRFRVGRLDVHFISPPRTADEAILNRLRQLGGEAKNYTVVSSDGDVQGGAQRAGARILSSQTFARLLITTGARKSDPAKPTPSLSEEDIKVWEELFRKGPNQAKGKI